MKTVSLENAVAMIPDGASLMVGGFMGVGTPERVMDELTRQGKRELTVIANDTATPGRGIGKLVTAGVVTRRPHPVHGRIQQLVLTDSGVTLLTSAKKRVSTVEKELVREVSADDEQALRQWLASVSSRLGDD